VADCARSKKIQFVNHTFTTHLALSASLQPYAGFKEDDLCEFPFEPSALAREFTAEKLLPDAQGQIHIPDALGLGIEPDLAALEKYLVEVEIRVAGRSLLSSSRRAL
jgi:L-alanine-DL-glutamate epimerase-like enolase superfamily enzyme